MKKSYIFLAAFFLVVAAACESEKMRLQRPEELGTDKDEYYIPAEGGTVQMKVYTNMPGSLHLAGDAGWAGLSATEFTQDATIEISATENKETKRKVSIIVETQARKDTVDVLQYGAYDEIFTLGSTSVVAYNGNGGKTKVHVDSNIDPSRISFRPVYLDSEASAWISKVEVEEDSLVITAIDNPDEKKTRKAAIDIRYTDGWNELVVENLMVTQANSHNRIGNQLTFAELRAMAADEPVIINDDYTLEGYVVSDKVSGNAGDNIQSTPTTTDSTVCHRTAYLESLDGKYGIMLEFVTMDDNILENNSHAVVNLDGAVLHREGTADLSDNEPLRYYVTGLVSSKVVSCLMVSPGQIPVKEKRMSELTDDDIYTRVTIKDSEYPIRKGSLTPVNEGYAYLFGSQRFTKFPTLIRDIEGSSMYMFTNTTCTWRRDGTRMGYGRGSVTGVLVHEKYRRFIDKDAADEDLCGNIGKYQLRPMSRADFRFAESFADSFSEMICEWRYLTQGNAEDNSWNATYGQGRMDQSYPGSVKEEYNTHAYPVYSYSYLGPIIKGDVRNRTAFGIILEDGTDYGKDWEFATTGDGSKFLLVANNTIALSWMASNWWNTSRKAPEYWLVQFSTKGISTDHLSMQLSTLNTSQEGKSPIKWKAQWAESNVSSTVWKDIASYSVPDVVLWSATQPWQSPGYKPMNFELPLEMLDKEVVYIRLIPDGQKNNGSTPQGYLDTDYANGTAGSSSKACNAIEYFAIRYNK